MLAMRGQQAQKMIFEDQSQFEDKKYSLAIGIMASSFSVALYVFLDVSLDELQVFEDLSRLTATSLFLAIYMIVILVLVYKILNEKDPNL